AALRAASRFASLLDSGQKQRDQDRDDGDHDQKFDQGKSGTIGRTERVGALFSHRLASFRSPLQAARHTRAAFTNESREKNVSALIVRTLPFCWLDIGNGRAKREMEITESPAP